ncbi:MAG: hypothetical protein DRI99_08825 [Candidatus Aminicenantes bacterium]|nr:MAG: hypothetical protein DRI99_08825 [Candidatus Aminicenantes bacterium]
MITWTNLQPQVKGRSFSRLFVYSGNFIQVIIDDCGNGLFPLKLTPSFPWRPGLDPKEKLN